MDDLHPDATSFEVDSASYDARWRESARRATSSGSAAGVQTAQRVLVIVVSALMLLIAVGDVALGVAGAPQFVISFSMVALNALSFFATSGSSVLGFAGGLQAGKILQPLLPAERRIVLAQFAGRTSWDARSEPLLRFMASRTRTVLLGYFSALTAIATCLVVVIVRGRSAIGARSLPAAVHEFATGITVDERTPLALERLLSATAVGLIVFGAALLVVAFALMVTAAVFGIRHALLASHLRRRLDAGAT